MKVFALSAAIVVLAGCGGREAERADPPTLDRAAEQTAGAGSYRYTIDYDLTGVPGGMRGEGAFETRERGWLRVEFAGEGGDDELSSFEMRRVDGKTYTRFSTGEEAKWFVGAGESGELFELFGPFQSPHLALAALRNAAGDVAMIGEETVDGARTLRFRGRVPAWEIFGASASPKERKEIQAEMRKAGVGDVPVEVWVDDDALLRKLHVAFAYVEEGKDANVAITMRFFDFGKPVEVSAPPQSEIEDFSQSAGGAGASGFCELPGKPYPAPAVAAALRARGFTVAPENESFCVDDATTLFAYAGGSDEVTVCVVGRTPEVDEDARRAGAEDLLVEANVMCVGEEDGLARVAAALESLRRDNGG